MPDHRFIGNDYRMVLEPSGSIPLDPGELCTKCGCKGGWSHVEFYRLPSGYWTAVAQRDGTWTPLICREYITARCQVCGYLRAVECVEHDGKGDYAAV